MTRRASPPHRLRRPWLGILLGVSVVACGVLPAPTDGPMGQLCTATRHVATVVAVARTASSSARAGDSAGVQAAGEAARRHYADAQGATDAANLLITASGDRPSAEFLATNAQLQPAMTKAEFLAFSLIPDPGYPEAWDAQIGEVERGLAAIDLPAPCKVALAG